MAESSWIAFAALMVTIMTVSGGGLWALFAKMNSIKASTDTEVEAIRMAAYLEYKELRREMNDGWSKAYLEFGEAPKALREKINEVELFMRDQYVTQKTYARDQDQILAMFKALNETLDRRFTSLEKKFDEWIKDRQQK